MWERENGEVMLRVWRQIQGISMFNFVEESISFALQIAEMTEILFVYANFEGFLERTMLPALW